MDETEARILLAALDAGLIVRLRAANGHESVLRGRLEWHEMRQALLSVGIGTARVEQLGREIAECPCCVPRGHSSLN